MNKLKRKPLQNQALIYDKDCPMCCIYTSAFIRAGVLEKNGRQPYHMQASNSIEWDPERAKNEIALVNYESGKVTYGIDSMFTVIGHRFPYLKPLFNWKPFHWCMKKFYSFISYNRKVIAPPAKNTAEITCVPDVNLKYRWLYIFTAGIIAALLNASALHMALNYSFGKTFSVILAIIIMRIGFQMFTVKTTEYKTQYMDYLGNLSTTNLQFGFLVSVYFFLIHSLPATLLGFYLLGAIVYVNLAHFWRLKSLNMGLEILAIWLLQWLFIILIPAFL